jgi:hypothetical protein
MRHATPCKYCKSVTSVCFWGPLAEKPWKRPVLLGICTVSALCFLAAIAYFLPDLPHPALFTAFLMFLAVSIFGILVAVKGCDACVARLLGSA